jgi:hypothetical protein
LLNSAPGEIKRGHDRRMTPSTFSAQPVWRLPIGAMLKRDRSVMTEG